jgi:hypothetical protein
LDCVAFLEPSISEKFYTGSPRFRPDKAELIVAAILDLHRELIGLYSNTVALLEVPILLWTSLSVLHLSFQTYPNLYRLALKNCLCFFAENNEALLKGLGDHPQFQTLFNSLKVNFGGVQPLLLQSLFVNDKELCDQSFELLIASWKLLPERVVDANATGRLYLTLYTILWVFIRLKDQSIHDNEGQVRFVDSIFCVLSVMISYLETKSIDA